MLASAHRFQSFCVETASPSDLPSVCSGATYVALWQPHVTHRELRLNRCLKKPSLWKPSSEGGKKQDVFKFSLLSVKMTSRKWFMFCQMYHFKHSADSHDECCEMSESKSRRGAARKNEFAHSGSQVMLLLPSSGGDVPLFSQPDHFQVLQTSSSSGLVKQDRWVQTVSVSRVCRWGLFSSFLVAKWQMQTWFRVCINKNLSKCQWRLFLLFCL